MNQEKTSDSGLEVSGITDTDRIKWLADHSYDHINKVIGATDMYNVASLRIGIDQDIRKEREEYSRKQKEAEKKAKAAQSGKNVGIVNSGSFNKLTGPETERLALLMEEMSEACQIIGKILRHGYESRNPYNTGAGTNRDMLEKEIGHVMFAIRLALHNLDIMALNVQDSHKVKLRTVGKYLHYEHRMPGEESVI